MMAKKIKILWCSFLLLLIFNVTSFSQTVSEGIYNNEGIKYYKNKLILAYKLDSINYPSYINRANEYIAAHGGKIDSTYSSSNFTVIELTLSSDADALNYIDVFKNSNVFEFVCFNGVIEPD